MATVTKDIKRMAQEILEMVKYEYAHCDPYEAMEELVRVYKREEELTTSEVSQLMKELG
jgi:hypothetical protein